MPMFGVRNFALNQYLGSVKKQQGQEFIILGPQLCKKERSWNLVRNSQVLD